MGRIDSAEELKRLQEKCRENGGECLSTIYTSSNRKHKFRCHIGHNWQAVPSSIHMGTWCPTCAGNGKGSTTKLRKLATERGFTLLDKEYRGSHEKLRFRCKVCKNEVEISPTNLQNGRGCRFCKTEKSRIRNRKSIDDVREQAKQKGLLVISNENAGGELHFRCATCKKDIFATIKKITKASSSTLCHSCRPQRKHKKPYSGGVVTIDAMNAAFSTYGVSCVERVKQERGPTFLWKCNECNTTFKKSHSAMRRSPGCSACKSRNLGEEICRLSFQKLFGGKFPNRYLLWMRGTSGRMLSLDGINEKLGIAFEHHGLQHYRHVPLFHKDGHTLDKQKERDKLKRKLCAKNGIILVVIPDLIHESRSLERINAGQQKIPIPEEIIAACQKAGIYFQNKRAKLQIDIRPLIRNRSEMLLKEIRKIAQKSGFEVEGDAKYIRASAKIPARCLTCGYKWMVAPDKIRRGHGCHRCGKSMKLSLDSFVQLAKSRGHEILSKDYVNSQSLLQFRCKTCGYEWATSGNHYRLGTGCFQCSNGKKRSQTDAAQECMDLGWELLSRFENVSSTVHIRCVKCHSEIRRSFSNLTSKYKDSRCPFCKDIERRKEAHKLLKAKLLKRNILLLSKEYLGFKTEIQLRCKACGHEWDSTPELMRVGTGCRICGYKRRDAKLRLCIEDARKLAKRNGGECLSETYVNALQPLRWKCRLGHEWHASYNTIQQGHWCRVCCRKKS